MNYYLSVRTCPFIVKNAENDLLQKNDHFPDTIATVYRCSAEVCYLLMSNFRRILCIKNYSIAHCIVILFHH